MLLQNKKAIVTGASTGIGREIAIELAKDGAIVGLVGRNLQQLNETKKLIEKENGKAIIFQSDLSKLEEVNSLIESISNEFKAIDILANIAGIWHGEDEVYSNKDFETYSQQVILDTFFVGTIAPTLLSHGLIPFMKSKSKIINLSGTFEDGAKGWIPYYVSKRAIEDLTIALSQELAERDIQVNAISPSDTATESYKKYFPEYIDDSIDPKEIAKQAVFLCSSTGNKITGKVFVMKKDKKPHEGFHY